MGDGRQIIETTAENIRAGDDLLTHVSAGLLPGWEYVIVVSTSTHGTDPMTVTYADGDSCRFAGDDSVIVRRPVSVPEGDECAALHPQGYSCTLDPAHGGEHIAHGEDGEEIIRWRPSEAAISVARPVSGEGDGRRLREIAEEIRLARRVEAPISPGLRVQMSEWARRLDNAVAPASTGGNEPGDAAKALFDAMQQVAYAQGNYTGRILRDTHTVGDILGELAEQGWRLTRPAAPSLEAEGEQVSREGMEEIVASTLLVTLAGRGTTAMTFGEADAVAGEIVAALTDAQHLPSLVSGEGDEREREIADAIVEAQAELQSPLGEYRSKYGRGDATEERLSKTLARLHALLAALGREMAFAARFDGIPYPTPLSRPVSVSTGGDETVLEDAIHAAAGVHDEIDVAAAAAVLADRGWRLSPVPGVGDQGEAEIEHLREKLETVLSAGRGQRAKYLAAKDALAEVRSLAARGLANGIAEAGAWLSQADEERTHDALRKLDEVQTALVAATEVLRDPAPVPAPVSPVTEDEAETPAVWCDTCGTRLDSAHPGDSCDGWLTGSCPGTFRPTPDASQED